MQDMTFLTKRGEHILFVISMSRWRAREDSRSKGALDAQLVLLHPILPFHTEILSRCYVATRIWQEERENEAQQISRIMKIKILTTSTRSSVGIKLYWMNLSHE